MRIDGDAGHRSALTRKDLIIFERRLIDAVAALFPFKNHSIHFPRTLADTNAQWVDKEKKLLLPLLDAQDNVLGVFVARGLDGKSVTPLLPYWSGLNALITENLLLYKQSLCDPVTGLFARHYLLNVIARDIALMQGSMQPAQPLRGKKAQRAKSGEAKAAAALAVDENAPSRSMTATLVIRLAALKDVVREFGYQFADDLMAELADALCGVIPEQAVAARTGDSEFTAYLPAAGPKAAKILAGDIARALASVYLVHPLRKERVGVHPSVGYTIYPHDMTGNVFMRPPAEQARLALRKARLAAALATETPSALSGGNDGAAVLGFGSILLEGGRVLESLPLSRVLVSLGSSAHAREGHRFSVWSTRTQKGEGGVLTPLYKGEIVLMEVHDNVSQGEIIHLGEPGWNIEPGDQLVLLPEEQGSPSRREGEAIKKDPATGLLRHGDFLAAFSEEREKADSFALALIRLAPRPVSESPSEEGAGGTLATGQAESPTAVAGENTSAYGDDETDASLRPARLMAEAVHLLREEFPGAHPLLGGRYGLNSLIIFHPAPDVAQLTQGYERLARTIGERLLLDVAIGVAAHPSLDFRKADALENCQKALEYAMLLPFPHVGVLDTLALNISADKRFSQGDLFGAIKEYQRALLADESNIMAYNSLGICFARLQRHADAERIFADALTREPEDVMTLYNLGNMYQSQGRSREAKESYDACLTHDPEHLFAVIRLGQLAEANGETAAAREWYEKAATLPGGQGLTYRHFARLCVSENKPDEAREYLHESLLFDPQDAIAMTLLARLYLDAGEDPEMAASFARQSVSLKPELRTGWLELARALDALGREKDAKEARIKAGQIQ